MHNHLQLHCPDTTVLHRLDARVKVLVVFVLLLVIAWTPHTWRPVASHWPVSQVHLWAALLILGFACLARMPATTYARRLLRCLLPLLAVTATVPLLRGWQVGVPLMIAMLIKSSLAISLMLLLTYTTSAERVLWAARQLGMPRLLVATIAAMLRYLAVLQDETHRMRRAQRARTLRSSHWFSWSAVSASAGLIGVLFVRAIERAERVHAAMLARGYRGETHLSDEA